jgi:hypothetical protein
MTLYLQVDMMASSKGRIREPKALHRRISVRFHGLCYYMTLNRGWWIEIRTDTPHDRRAKKPSLDAVQMIWHSLHRKTAVAGSQLVAGTRAAALSSRNVPFPTDVKSRTLWFSYVFCCPNYLPSDLCPIDLIINTLVHQSTQDYCVAPDQI